MGDSAAKHLQAVWLDTGEAGGGGFEAAAIGIDQGIGVDDDFDTAVLAQHRSAADIPGTPLHRVMNGGISPQHCLRYVNRKDEGDVVRAVNETGQ